MKSGKRPGAHWSNLPLNAPTQPDHLGGGGSFLLDVDAADVR